jgi:hypothetical protein
VFELLRVLWTVSSRTEFQPHRALDVTVLAVIINHEIVCWEIQGAVYSSRKVGSYSA